MGRKSTVKRLPPEIRQEIDRLLGEEHTLDEILDHLRQLGADGVSRSSLGRYAQDYRAVAARIRELQATAAGFAQELGVVEESQAHQTLVQMLHAMLVRFGMAELKNEEPTVDPRDMMFLAKTIRDAMASSKDREAIRAQAAKEAREQAAEQAEAAARQAGLSGASVARIRAEILGVQ